MDLWYFDGPPDEHGRLDRIFNAVSNRSLFAGHFHKWLLATPQGIIDWCGDRVIHLDGDSRYSDIAVDVIAARGVDRCAERRGQCRIGHVEGELRFADVGCGKALFRRAQQMAGCVDEPDRGHWRCVRFDVRPCAEPLQEADAAREQGCGAQIG